MPCDSGIPDYRGPNGLWRRDPEAEKLVTYEYYMGDPEIRRRSWQMRRKNRTLRAEPNAAHRAVAELERAGVPVRVITQNVDGLHQLAGIPARKVLELHGTARSVVCTKCHARGPMEDALARVEAGEDDPPCLECGGILKSATVMFGERLIRIPRGVHEQHGVRGVAGKTVLGGGPQLLTASAMCRAAWAGVRCVVSTTSASPCSHVRAASA
ncbi:Sir2 family NAD-dependent protein deacetylase [Streptomyces sp. NPDC059866]|uniref:Sir2 family NAD-dependent protein deacetylase n=1 Tax=Streptomyces sp. NPDC059866 TaxID=3346978 RepID=UPI003657B46D